ncbi:ABC transporter permease [Marinobacter nanhaiticus D15-8W]|uniref:Transport permease protein n=1 Tax=Marinobacter nanhaiticus D15-8W TaxID=626887 RepID=N6VSX4_9GAMM|nr:ABC transporter permease [Marinobacter nanhaiticus]ENO13225.1 ABC transporter permease [Marinobacter nanhaiticus D15-8W]BES70586.1 ABC transporter permease [Marinobacter nanhaiticus D15-8W]
MAFLRNVYHLGIKELRSLRRDRVLLIFVVVAFTFMVYTAGTGGSTDLHNAPVAVVDEDQSVLSEAMVNSLQPPWFLPPDTVRMHEIDRVLDQGTHTFAIVIPSGFERDVREGRQPSIQLNIDATRMSQAFIGSNYIQQLFTTEAQEFLTAGSSRETSPLELVTRTSFNPNLDGTWFGGAMELIQQITMISIILTGAALIREREHGTIEHLMVMPLSPLEIMLAKVWANGLVILLATAISITLIIHGFLAMPVRGSILLFLAGTLVHLFSTTSIGILIATVARSMPQLGLLIFLVILPLQMLSGAMTPVETMPSAVQAIMQLAPTTHFVSLAQAILYRGADLSIVWPQFLALLGIGLVVFLFALVLFRKHLAS